ncbi:MAG: hypothetical protein CM15mP129_11670 [Chloroflexota bacterium]|nr:MAG: hypothetical protein CM15mP129_11670 [Chloroflexota bacterium]
MEVLSNYQRKKIDERNDEEFYSDPKFVYHLDSISDNIYQIFIEMKLQTIQQFLI